MHVFNGNLMRSGFTLLEVCCVIFILVIITSITISTISNFDRFILKSELNNLYLACMSLQKEAKATGQEKTIAFNIKNNSYKIEDENYELSKQICFGVLDNVKGPPSDPQKVQKNPLTFEKNQIKFYTDGTVQSGTVYLIDKKKRYQFALASGIEKMLYITIYFYENNKWLIYK
jgi:prepilin-type N-terminal cleavage/methylation domain-containing protein